jgi:MtrB/PioB family decaheme-associated outer membrane protein
MRRNNQLAVLTVCASAMFLAAVSAHAQVTLGNYTATGSVEAGAIPQPVPVTSAARFQEYRDFAQQFIAPQLSLVLGDPKEDFTFEFNAINVAQKNEMYNLRFGDPGRLDVQVQWQEIPHAFSNDIARTPYQDNSGVLTLPSKPAPPAPGSAPGSNIRTWLNSTARPIDLSLLEGIANLNIRYTPNDDWTYTAYFNYQNPTGERAFGTMFGSTPGSYNIAELAEPIQYYTYNYGLGAEYNFKGWLFGLKYDGSFFHNAIDTLTWANPNTWSNPVSAHGGCVNSAAYSPTGGVGPCNGQMSTYPDNQAHTVTANVGGDLPLNTRLMVSASYGFWLQNSPFIPYTSNTALPTGSLPYSSLHGDVQPAFVNATLVSHPVEKLELKATYSYFNYDNQTPTINFRNVLAFNDVASLWSATSNPFSFSDQDINLAASYKLTSHLALRFVGDLQTYHNSGFMVLQQDQTSYGPILDWTPYDWTLFRASYQHSYRDSPGYNNNRGTLTSQTAGETELADLRRFDEATVEVNQAELYAQAMPREDLTLFASFDYDDYNFPATDIGLQHASSYSPSVGVNYAPFPNVSVYSDYSWQAYDWNLRSMERATAAPSPIQPNCPSSPGLQTPGACPGQVWNGLGRDQGSSVEVGFDTTIPANRILPKPSHLKVDYTYEVGTDAIHRSGDPVLDPATNFPGVGNQFHELILNYSYPVTSKASLNVGYYFTHFGENDFGVDQMAPSMSGSPQSTFLGNTTYTPYDANMAYLTLSVKF